MISELKISMGLMVSIHSESGQSKNMIIFAISLREIKIVLRRLKNVMIYQYLTYGSTYLMNLMSLKNLKIGKMTQIWKQRRRKIEWEPSV